MNLGNFKKYIDKKVLKKVQQQYWLSFYYTTPDVWGSRVVYEGRMAGKNVSVVIEFDVFGEVKEMTCSACKSEGICWHKAAVLMWLDDNYESDYFNVNDRYTKELIQDFSIESAKKAVLMSSDEAYPTVEPELFLDERSGKLVYRLKFGREKKYVVKNIYEFMNRFARHQSFEYGKALTVLHDPGRLDDKSYQLMKISMAIADRYSARERKDFILDGDYQDQFFELYKGECVNVSGHPYEVVYGEPEVKLVLEKLENEDFTVRLDMQARFLSVERRGLFLDEKERRIYMADPDFSRVMSNLYNALYAHKLVVHKENISAFANSVLKGAMKYMPVEGMELLGDYQPPQFSASLFLEPEDGSIQGRLIAKYGDQDFDMPYAQKRNPFCDYESEAVIQHLMEKYMYFEQRRWWCDGEDEDALYALLTEGLPRLNGILDVYLSEEMANFRIRPSTKPAVGIRPGKGSMLELELTCSGCSNEELIEMLQAYRKGKKYVRMKDGTFAALDESIQVLDELTENLNITDRALLKEKIHIPFYRMLYLDSLGKDTDALRLNRSQEFKKSIAEFRSSLDETKNSQVPKSLENIMRDYQKYGYAWMKTIANYGFGGILADDMGLGKTIQALALILDYKQSGGNLPSLVVCPSSLVLNWASEIEKFAPNLKSLLVQGPLSLRMENLKKCEDYDVLITSYSTLTRDIAEYEEKKFHFEFIDEAQYIKNQNTQMAKAVKGIQAQVRFALTGTPVENSLAELWSIFDYIMPGYLFNYSHFKSHFETPIVSHTDQKQVKALQKNVGPFILRRMKKEVLSELPDKTVSVLRCAMDEEQSRLYSANIAEMKKMLMHDFEDQSARFKLLAMITRLRQICCDPHLAYENYEGTSAKLNQCMELVQDCTQSGHKILLFSQFTSMLDLLAEELKKQGISYYMLTGKTSAKQRMSMVEQFNSDDTQVFLISLKAGGTGLNLTGADIVIHFDPWWNVSAENQASDRAYRIGQKRNVQIYKLVADGTIEDKILMLQESKSELFDIAVNGEGDIMRMKAEDILDLLA